MLNAFGTMGSVYMNKVMGRKDPAVALVNNGAEDTKGTPMYREAHGLLKDKTRPSALWATLSRVILWLVRWTLSSATALWAMWC